MNVYVPMFVQTNMHPTVPDGPSIILTTRDLMKDKIPDRVKNILLDHAVTWLSPTNVAVVAHQESPPILAEDVKKVRDLSVYTRALAWSKKDIRSFLVWRVVVPPV